MTDLIQNLTDDEKVTAGTDILKHYGALIEQVQGTKENPRRIVGTVTLQFYEDGQYGYGLAGFLSKAITLGALTDTQLIVRELIMQQETIGHLQGLIESSRLQPKDIN